MVRREEFSRAHILDGTRDIMKICISEKLSRIIKERMDEPTGAKTETIFSVFRPAYTVRISARRRKPFKCKCLRVSASVSGCTNSTA